MAVSFLIIRCIQVLPMLAHEYNTVGFPGVHCSSRVQQRRPEGPPKAVSTAMTRLAPRVSPAKQDMMLSESAGVFWSVRRALQARSGTTRDHTTTATGQTYLVAREASCGT